LFRLLLDAWFDSGNVGRRKSSGGISSGAGIGSPRPAATS